MFGALALDKSSARIRRCTAAGRYMLWAWERRVMLIFPHPNTFLVPRCVSLLSLCLLSFVLVRQYIYAGH